MSDMKCPFCQHEFREIYFNGVGVGYICPNPKCKPAEHFKGNKELWQALIDTKKKLDRSLNLAEEMLRDIEDEGMCSSYYEEELHQIKDKD